MLAELNFLRRLSKHTVVLSEEKVVELSDAWVILSVLKAHTKLYPITYDKIFSVLEYWGWSATRFVLAWHKALDTNFVIRSETLTNQYIYRHRDHCG